MLSGILYWLVNMSVLGSIAGGIVWLVGKIRKIPRWIVCWLWAIPLLRLWVPVALRSKFSLMQWLAKYTARTVEISNTLSAMNSVQHADSYAPIHYQTANLAKIWGIAAVLWMVVAVCFTVYLCVLYRISMAESKHARALRDNISISDRIQSPAVYGILKPRILLPTDYDPDALPYILRHEQAHIRRRDNLWRVVALVTACIHWFNPFGWLFLKVFLEQLELACDESVLRRCDGQEQKAYANALLTCAESRKLYVSAFGGAKLRTRIGYILSYQRLSVFALIFLSLFAAILGYALLTNP